MKKRILVSIPNQGWIHKLCAFDLLRIDKDPRYDTTIMLPTHSPYDNNLNLIIADFLDGGYDYWLTFDADNPPRQNPLDLVELDKDIMVLPTPQWHSSKEEQANGDYPIFINAMDEVEGQGFKEHKPKEGLQQIDAGGSGCLLIARRVLLKDHMHFARIWDAQGRVVQGADFTFCQKAKKQYGFTIWTHYDYLCHHFKELDMVEVIAAFAQYHAKQNQVPEHNPNVLL